MNDHPAARRCGVKRIEQHVCHDLHNFTSEGQNGSIRLKALMNNNSLLLSLGAIKVRYFAEHRIQFELQACCHPGET